MFSLVMTMEFLFVDIADFAHRAQEALEALDGDGKQSYEVDFYSLINKNHIKLSWHDENTLSLNASKAEKEYAADAYYLAHWGWDKMAAVSQTMFSNAFCLMKMYEFHLKCHWSLFLRFQLTIFRHWLRYWLGTVQVTSHYLNQWWLVYWCIYASLSLNELTSPSLDNMTTIQQTTLSKAFSWMKSFLFWFKFHWNLSLRIQLKISQDWFR